MRMSKEAVLMIRVKGSGNIIGLKEDIAMRLAGVADIERIDVVEDAAAVVHGHWYMTEYEYFGCSVCGGTYYNGCETSSEARDILRNGDAYRFCPNCGAKMDGERKEK